MCARCQTVGDRSLRIAHVFNLANIGWSTVKGLRAIGIDAHLIVRRPAHVVSLPQWEEAEIDLSRVGEDYNPNWEILNENWSMPNYVHIFDTLRPWYATNVDSVIGRMTHDHPKFVNWLRSYSFNLMRFWATVSERRGRKTEHQFIRVVKDYDLIVGHAPFACLAPRYKAVLQRPYIIYDAGWIRYLHEPTYASPWYRLAEIGYKHASKILFANVDLYGMLVRKGYDQSKLAYTPLAIDTEVYRPLEEHGLSVSQDESPVFLMPSRPDPTKGNMSVFYAFQRYLKRRPNAVLRLVNWDPQQEDLPKHLALIKKLGVEKRIRRLPLMHKRLLIRHFNAADVVFDQFKLGALGLLSPEAMSCAKPVVAFVEPGLWTPWHKEPPPVANARNAEEIYRQMVALEDEGMRRELGAKGRQWVLDNCEMRLVAKNQLRIYEETMRR